MTPRERALAVAAGATIGAWALGAFVVRPMLDWREAVQDRVVKLSARVARGEVLLAQSAYWRRRAAKGVESEMTSPNALMKEVDRMARAAGVRIKDFRPEVSKNDVRIAVTTEAPWAALSRFGSRLARESDALRIEKVEIQRAGENVGELRGRFVIALKDRDK